MLADRAPLSGAQAGHHPDADPAGDLILLLQPDVGQTGLLLSLWGAMLFFAGLPLFWVGCWPGATAVDGRGPPM